MSFGISLFYMSSYISILYIKCFRDRGNVYLLLCLEIELENALKWLSVIRLVFMCPSPRSVGPEGKVQTCRPVAVGVDPDSTRAQSPGIEPRTDVRTNTTSAEQHGSHESGAHKSTWVRCRLWFWMINKSTHWFKIT